MSDQADEMQSPSPDLDEQLAGQEDDEGFDEEEGEELEEEEEEEEFLNNHDLIGVDGIILEQKKEIEQKKVSALNLQRFNSNLNEKSLTA